MFTIADKGLAISSATHLIKSALILSCPALFLLPSFFDNLQDFILNCWFKKKKKNKLHHSDSEDTMKNFYPRDVW